MLPSSGLDYGVCLGKWVGGCKRSGQTSMWKSSGVQCVVALQESAAALVTEHLRKRE